MESISCHITPLVINSLEGGYTHKHTCTHTNIHTETILRNQVHQSRASMPGLKIVTLGTVQYEIYNWNIKIWEEKKLHDTTAVQEPSVGQFSYIDSQHYSVLLYQKHL